MTRLIPFREHFRGSQLLSPAWTLRKDGRTADCNVWSHQFGFELRLDVTGDPLPRTQVCRSQDELIRTIAEWRDAFASKGWL